MSLLVSLFAAVVMAPAAAHAVPYPADPPPAVISDGTVEPGGTVTFSGTGFQPFEVISIDIGYDGSDSTAAYRPSGGFVLAAFEVAALAKITTKADANGNFSIEVPLAEAGTATLVATGLTSGKTVTALVEVVVEEDEDEGDDDGGNGGGGGDDDNGDDGDDETLPTTGPSGTPLMVAGATGVGATLLGIALLWLTRTRRRRDTEA
ncbi:hypothetical protein QLQ12_21985 [Actinoplanes sp. NEAU-A12]|uniref:Gram-positive cocci surface proteins LPxTG domain-containing protein n=1 Tax=Actinoplanes sandaracinus TaxID=3045177 RepID=A0ABT6WNI9_9ACTN|nr:hypothetical protein [Actinoplanes sandaracinus]MDI6101289.1 hypothetical protein [Actinoplanes sandaracinus]